MVTVWLGLGRKLLGEVYENTQFCVEIMFSQITT